MKMSSILIASLLMPLSAMCAESLSGKEFQQGIDNFNSAEYSRAYSFFDELKSKSESDAEFQYYYGLTLLMTSNSKEAVEVMKRAIELAPDNAEYHFALARIYETRQREISVFKMPGLVRSFKQTVRNVLEIDPQHVGAIRIQANIYLTIPSILGGDIKAGQALLSKLRELDQAAAFLVEANTVKGKDFERAEELLLMAINTTDSSVVIQASVTLARLYIEQEQYSKAIPYLEQSLALPWDWSATTGINERHVHLAISYHLLDDEINSRKHVVAAIKTAVTRRDRKELEYWFDKRKIKY